MNLKLACADFTFPLLTFEQTLDLMVMLEIPGVDVGLFEGVQHLTPSAELEDVEGSARRLKDALESRGLELADVFMVAALDRESLAPNNPDSEIEALLPHASHFHVRGARKDRLQAPFSENTIDYERVLTLMRDQNYRGYQALEYVWIEWEHCNECDNLSETILFRDHLRKAAEKL